MSGDMIAAWTAFEARERPRVTHWSAFQAGWEAALSAPPQPSAAWRGIHTAPRDGTQANGPALQAYVAEVAKDFGGKLPGDAWHLYMMKGLSPAQAAAKHRLDATPGGSDLGA